MRCYCILYARSHAAKPPVGMLRPQRLQRFEITDRESPEERASAERLRKSGLVRQMPFRYYWVLSSQGRVTGISVFEHVKWLFENLKPTFKLSQLKTDGTEYGLSFYWEGTGSGPEVTPELAELLALHQVTLAFSFYT